LAEMNIVVEPVDSFEKIVDLPLVDDDLEGFDKLRALMESDVDASSLDAIYDTEGQAFGRAGYRFFEQLKVAVLNATSPDIKSTKKIDLLAHSLITLCGLEDYPFSLTAEKLNFNIGGRDLSTEDDVYLVQEYDSRRIQIMLHSIHFANYSGNKGAYHLIGNMLAAVLHNDRITFRKEAEFSVFGLRLSGDELSIFVLDVTRQQLDHLLEGSMPSSPIKVLFFPGVSLQSGHHGLSLSDPTQRYTALNCILRIEKYLRENIEMEEQEFMEKVMEEETHEQHPSSPSHVIFRND